MSYVYNILKLTCLSAANVLLPDDELLDNIIAHDKENRCVSGAAAGTLTEQAQYVSF